MEEEDGMEGIVVQQHLCSAQSSHLQGRVWREWSLFPLPGWLWEMPLSWLGGGSLSPSSLSQAALGLGRHLCARKGCGAEPFVSAQVLGQVVSPAGRAAGPGAAALGSGG